MTLLKASTQITVLESLAEQLTFSTFIRMLPGDVPALVIGGGFEVVYPSEQIGFDVWRNGEPFRSGFHAEGQIVEFIETLR